MADKTKGQRMWCAPGTIPRGGLMMVYCLELTPIPSLIFMLIAVLFWLFMASNLYGYIVSSDRTQLVTNSETLVLAETSRSEFSSWKTKNKDTKMESVLFTSTSMQALLYLPHIDYVITFLGMDIQVVSNILQL